MNKFWAHFLSHEYLTNNETNFSFFFFIFVANAREYFLAASHHFPVPSTEVPERVQLVWSMELLAITSILEVRGQYKNSFEGF